MSATDRQAVQRGHAGGVRSEGHGDDMDVRLVVALLGGGALCGLCPFIRRNVDESGGVPVVRVI